MEKTLNKIVKCKIYTYPRPMPEGIFDPMPQVWVTLNNGTKLKLFEFYPDEIDFQETEFIGLTIEQAHELRREKEIQYIQS